MAPGAGGSGGGSGGGGPTLDASETRRRKRALEEYAEVMHELGAEGVRLKDVLGDAGVNMQRFSALSAESRENLIRLRHAQLELARAHGATGEQIKTLQDGLRLLNRATSEYIDYAGLMNDKIRGMMGITNAWSSNMHGIMAASLSSGKSWKELVHEIADETDDAKKKANRWGSMTMKATEMVNSGFYAILKQTMSLVNAIDAATVSFRRSTGASQELVDAIPALESKFYTLGLSAEDAANVMGSLYSSMSGFTRLGPSAQRAVRETTAVLETLGIESASSAQSMEILNRSMGYSGSQAANITQQLFGLAQQLNISTTQMMDDFTRLGPQLVVHGKRAVNVFVQLEASAKQSGIAIDRLLSIASNFDTFKGAAENVGHLNAVLGGPYLSVMKMVQQTDPSERMKMLAQATRQAGMSFDQMSYYQRKAIAEAAGLQDVNELALVMKSRFDLVGGSVKMNANEIEKLAEENKKYKTVQQELQQVMRSLAGPVTEVLKNVRWLLQVMQDNIPIVKAMAVTILGLKAAMVSLQVAAWAAQAGMTGLAATLGPLSLLIGVAVAAMGAWGYATMHETHSPPLYGKNGGISMASQQNYQLASSFGQIAKYAGHASPQLSALGKELNAMPDSKMIHIKKVFDAEAGVLDASQGAQITAHTVRLLGAATGAQASGRPIMNHMDLTTTLDGNVIAHTVAKKLSDSRNS